MSCDTKTAATVWAPSYKLATIMQASLSIISFLAGLASWLLGGSVMWLISGMIIGSVVPLTFIAIMPTNKLLLAPARDLASEETRRLLNKWGKLHGVRSALSFIAAVIYIILLFNP